MMNRWDLIYSLRTHSQKRKTKNTGWLESAVIDGAALVGSLILAGL